MGRQNGQASLERYVQFASPVSVEVDEEESEEDFLKQIDDFIAAGGKEDYDSAFSLLRQKEKKVMNNISCEYTCVLCKSRVGMLEFIVYNWKKLSVKWRSGIKKMKWITLEILVRTCLPGWSVMCNSMNQILMAINKCVFLIHVYNILVALKI